MSRRGDNKQDDFLAGSPRWMRYSAMALMVSFLVSILAGIADKALYMKFLSDRDVGFFETPGWDLYWEYHSGPVGGTLFVLEFAPYVIALLALGGFSLWHKLGDRA